MNTDAMSGTYKIRPAGRHILTIGRDLIQDRHAAVVELVKNAYDADSPDVHIEFTMKPNNDEYTIVISDHGHGMSRDTVINKWMVPSTQDKMDKRTSPSGRIMQGRKGIGRYAASILGKDMLLETISAEGEKTTVFVEWNRFETAQYLDDVEILIETVKTTAPSGTRLTMTGDMNFLTDWNKKQFEKLQFELKKLMPPVSVNKEAEDNDFQISLNIDGFPVVQDISEVIKPYPLFDFFDYRITGKLNTDGKGVLIYSLQKARNTTEEKIIINLESPTGCGELVFDIRVYDREKDAIDTIIQRGLKDESGNYFGNLNARQLLNEYNGIGVYRNGFRIRPLGDAGFDWLKLNKRRVQNPSLRIGSDQAIGYVQIQSEKLSGLIEKSARDGLRENEALNQLERITLMVIAKLEEQRFDYRKKAGLSRTGTKVERQLDRLFSFDDLKQDIHTKLLKGRVDKNITSEILEIIDRDAEDKNKTADDIRQTVAIYQGQATLGKIINVILHEGRRPLSYFRNQVPRIRKKIQEFQRQQIPELTDEICEISDGIGNNAEVFVSLFSRLDPLAAGKRSTRKPLVLKKSIQETLSVFDVELKKNHIKTNVTGTDVLKFPSWQQDIYAIFTNLIDNSIYWIIEKNTVKREINIEVVTEGDSLLYIDYRDTGPGIEPDLIAREVIFDPQFSTKPSGTGLGLAIAGEAAVRNGLELKAFECDTGAYFRVQAKEINT